jgi:hypothetical protein
MSIATTRRVTTWLVTVSNEESGTSSQGKSLVNLFGDLLGGRVVVGDAYTENATPLETPHDQYE